MSHDKKVSQGYVSDRMESATEAWNTIIFVQWHTHTSGYFLATDIPIY